MRCKKKGTKCVGRLLEIVGIDVMAVSVGTGTHLESWRKRKRVSEFISCNAKTAGA